MGRQPHLIVDLAAVACLLALTGCKEQLYSGLDQQEASAMLLVLSQHGLDASKRATKEGGESIFVDESRIAEAISVLSKSGFPRKKFESMLDVFKPGGLVPTPTEERARFLYAIGQELAAAVSQIDGVLSAQVNVVLPENDLLARSATPSSASVFVRYEADSGVDRLVPQLKTLVAGSVEGLQYDRVSVVLVPVTPRPLPPPAPSTPAASASVGVLALAALAGALAACGVGAIALRLRDRGTALAPGTKSADEHVAAGRMARRVS
jgi:type III secretion protein J